MSAAPILTFYLDGEKISENAIEGEMLVGRSEGCVIRLSDRAISRRHALLKQIDKGLQIERKSDFSPISVNGAECTSAVLKEGDMIGLGPYLARVTYPKAVELKPSALPELAALVSQPDVRPEPMLVPTELIPPGAQAALSVQPLPALDASQAAAAPSSGISLEPVLQPMSSESPSLGFEGGLQQPDGFLQPPAAVLAEPPGDEDRTLLGNPAKVIIILNPNTATPVEYVMDSVEAVIGRSKECHIQINDKKSSRRHAKITRRGLSFFAKDLDTVNGTYVNGQKINETELTGEDLIQIGDTELRFKVVNPNFSQQANAAPPVGDMTSSLQDMMNQGGSSGPSLEAPPTLDVASAFPPVEQYEAQQQQQQQAPIPAAAVMPQAFGAMPGMAAPAAPFQEGGVAGMGAGKKQTLLSKFRALPKQRQALVGALILGLVAFLLFTGDEEKPKPQPKTAVSKKGAKDGEKDAKTATFESLTAEQKTFVETQYTLGLDYYKNKDYDKSLYEIRKIFQLIPDYKDARQIERYAQEAKRIIESREEEKKKDEEAKRVKARVVQLIEQGQQLMSEKKYEKVQDVFSDILELDPENTTVAKWKAEIQEFYAAKQIQEENSKRIKEEGRLSWGIYQSGAKLLEQKKYYPAISTFQKAIELATGNRKVIAASKKGIVDARAAIKAMIDPVLEEAKKAEDSGDAMTAFKQYYKASKLDPRNDAAYAGMDRVRGALQQKAKEIYAEAVIAESYSDFTSAEKHYREVLDMVPEDDIYYDRAKSRLKRYAPYARFKESE